jgi:hypothetical protein
MSEQINFEHEIVIKPSKSWFSIDWKGIWDYRDMLRFLVMRDFISRFKQTLLGAALVYHPAALYDGGVHGHLR